MKPFKWLGVVSNPQLSLSHSVPFRPILDIDKSEKVPSDLKRLKSKVDKSDIGELETTTVDLRKLIDLVKIKLLKRLNMMNWLKKVNAIQTTIISYLVKKNWLQHKKYWN